MSVPLTVFGFLVLVAVLWSLSIWAIVVICQIIIRDTSKRKQ